MTNGMLVEHMVVGGLAAYLGYYLSQQLNQSPASDGWWMFSTVSIAVLSALAANIGLLLFRPQKAMEVLPVEEIPMDDPRRPPVYEKGPHWVVDCTQEAKIYYPEKGNLSKENTPSRTMIEVMDEFVTVIPDSTYLLVERPVPEIVSKGIAPSLPIEEWKKWTVREYITEGKNAAKGFIQHGLEMFGCVSMFGFNAPEWHMASIGAVFAGAKFGGIYPSDSSDNIKYKLHHSSTSIVVVEDGDKLKKVLIHANDLPDLVLIVLYMCESKDKAIKRPGLPDVKIMTWAELVEEGGKSGLDAELEKRKRNIRPGHCCCLIYTSGTTGNPKAVMVSHDNILATASAICHSWHRTVDKMRHVRLISYLPLSHIAGMILDIWMPMITPVRYPNASPSIYFARPYDLKENTIVNRFISVRPNIFLGVPRVWEKIAEKLQAVGKRNTGLKLWLSTWAKKTMLEHISGCQITGDGHYPPRWGIANLFLGIVRKKLGLDDVSIAVTAAAPISSETLEYFASLGIPIIEVYAMSETSGLMTLCTPETHLYNTVGFSPEGFEVNVFHINENTGKKTLASRAKDIFNPTEEEQGELCCRGRNVMMGYMANMKYGTDHIEEIKKKSSEVIDDEGYLHSGDKGTHGANGMFKITGRYKELIITAGGENISPVPIENDVKKNCPAISNIIMVGDKLKYNTALITLKCEGATVERPGTNRLRAEAKDVNPKVTTTEEAANDPIWQKLITDAITATNNNPAVCVSQPSKIQKFHILPRDFSIETEEFTATLKLKRSFVQEKYKKEIASMY